MEVAVQGAEHRLHAVEGQAGSPGEALQADTGLEGDKERNLALTQAWASVVREYLAKKFKLDDARIKTKGMAEGTQTDGKPANRLEILVYPTAG